MASDNLEQGHRIDSPAEAIKNQKLRDVSVYSWIDVLKALYNARRAAFDSEGGPVRENLPTVEANQQIAERAIVNNLLAQNLTPDELILALGVVSHSLLEEILTILISKLKKMKDTSERANVVRVAKAVIHGRKSLSDDDVVYFQNMLGPANNLGS